jgi:Zn-dependent protease
MNFLDSIVYLLALIISIGIHEAAHAWTAWKLGDNTAYDQGRVTLNPLAHIDPIGTVVIPLFNLMSGGVSLIGWGKPCPVEVRNFPAKTWRRDSLLVTLAGPASNVVLAILALIVCRFLDPENTMVGLFWHLARLNCCLCVFNLLPIPPLDGGWVVMHLFRLPMEFMMKGALPGVIILLVLINIPAARYVLGIPVGLLLHGLGTVIFWGA